MVKLSRCTTVLLAVLILSLASISTTHKASAQEVSMLQGKKAPEACLMTQFLVASQSDCKPLIKKQTGLTPTAQILLPTPPSQTDIQEIDSNEPTNVPEYAPTVPIEAFSAPTATLSADVLFNLVNSHRNEINLPPLEHDSNVCAVASSRTNEIAQEIFVTHKLHAGFYAKNLPYFATENLIWQHTEQEALNWWLHSPIHRAAVEGNYKYACGVCNGEVCNMVFTSYEQKILTSSASGQPSLAYTTQTSNQDTIKPLAQNTNNISPVLPLKN